MLKPNTQRPVFSPESNSEFMFTTQTEMNYQGGTAPYPGTPQFYFQFQRGLTLA